MLWEKMRDEDMMAGNTTKTDERAKNSKPLGKWLSGTGESAFAGRIPALPFFVIIAVFCVALLVIFNEVRQWPYLGAQFSADPASKSLTVHSVQPGGPADQAGLAKGDRIIAMENPKTLERYETTGREATAGRHQLHTYDDANRAGKAMVKAWDLISNGPVILHTADGKAAKITPTYPRPLSSLPVTVYTAILQSFLVLTIAAGIFVFAARSLSVSLLTLSGLGLSINMLTNSLLAARELVLSPTALESVALINAFASVLFIYSLLALLWYFPSRINAFPFAPVILFIGFSILAIQHFQIFEFPIHAFQIPNLLPFPLAIAISFIQWRRSRDKPVERASVMWFMLSIYGVTSLVILFYSAPIMVGFPPIIGPHIATFTLSFIYIGIALGTLKFRLFDMHAIWWKSIVWLLGGLVVFLIDILLIAQFDLEQAQALPLALFLAGWAYFPLRQAIVGYFIGSREVKLADHVPDIIETFSKVDDIDEFEGRFVAFLRRVFRVTDISRISAPEIQTAALGNNGLTLQVPKLLGEGAVELVGKASGRQLFSRNDVRIADGFTSLARNMMAARQRETAKLNESREQIVRDLHDDVGGKLLSLILKAPQKETADAARETLAALKESLIVVEDTQSIDTSIAFDQIFLEAKQRLKDAKHAVDIQSKIEAERVLSAREYINLKRTVQEIVSNLIKYAVSGTAQISLNVKANGAIDLKVLNLVGEDKETSASGGRGLANMERRASEIGASFNMEQEKTGEGERQFSVHLSLPPTE